MQDNKSFFSLDNKGVIHHVHSDSYSIFMIYEDTEDDKLYKLTLSKDYVVNSASHIHTSEPVSTLTFTKWHRHYVNSFNEVVFKGCLRCPTGEYRFSIDHDNLTLDAPVATYDNFSFDTLQCLKGIEIDSHVQKANLLYIIGWDIVRSEQVFIETNIGEDKATRRYVLTSEKGNLILHSINLDPWQSRIYIAGELVTVESKKAQSTPYLETLCYRKPLD